jgi:hypothetical protein
LISSAYIFLLIIVAADYTIIFHTKLTITILVHVCYGTHENLLFKYESKNLKESLLLKHRATLVLFLIFFKWFAWKFNFNVKNNHNLPGNSAMLGSLLTQKYWRHKIIFAIANCQLLSKSKNIVFYEPKIYLT